MDKCLQNQAWIAEFDRLVSLIDVVQVTLIGKPSKLYTSKVCFAKSDSEVNLFC